MKLKAFEEIINEFGGYYESSQNDSGTMIFVKHCMSKVCLFPDELKKMQNKVKKLHNGKLQYICSIEHGLKLCYVINV